MIILQKFSLLLIFCCWCEFCRADNFFYDEWHANSTGIGLQIAHETFSFPKGFPYADVVITSIDAYLFDYSYGWFHGGVLAGRSFVSLTGRGELGDDALAGYFGGITFRTGRWVTDNTKIGLDIRYHYQKVFDEEALDTPELAWHGWNVRLGALSKLLDDFGVYYGVNSHCISGHHKAGAMTSLISTCYYQSFFGGLDVWVDRGGNLGVEGQLGEVRKIAVYFQRRY